MTRRVAVIGPGRVGTAVAYGLVRAGHRVVAVAGGSGASAASFASAVAGCRVHDDAAAAVRVADLVLVTPPDRAIEEVVTDVARADGWRPDHRVVHCSGALGLAALRRAELMGARTAALHPAQTVPDGAGADVLVGASWAVTARPGDRRWAHDLVADLGGDPFDLAEEARGRYHAALTLGANAVGAAVATARALLLSARVPSPDRVLTPLVEASVRNVLGVGASALTGPVVRGDLETVAAHLDALEGDLPGLADDYRALQSVVLSRVRPSLHGSTATAIAVLLGLDATADEVAPDGPGDRPG